MLPEGWSRSTLGEIAKIASGGTPDRSKPEYWGGDVAWVTTGEIQFNTIVDTTEKITMAGLQNSSAKLFPPGTLLMAMYGQGKTRGQLAKLGIEATTNQNSAAILLNDGYEPDFYFHYLSSQYENIRDLGQAGGISHLNAGLLKQIPVPVAPVTEQRRIAHILSTWDQAIASTEEILEITKRWKRAIIFSIFSKSQINHSWKASTLGKVATIAPSNVDKKTKEGEREVRLCNYTDVYYNERISREIPFMRATATDSEIKKFSLLQGDVLITKDSEKADDIAVSARVTEDISDLVCGYHLTLIRPDQRKIDSTFLHCHFNLPETKSYFSSNANGVTRFGLPLPAIKEAPIFFPSINEQRKIGKIISNAELEVENLARAIQLLKKEKSALMSQLLTGKRRVRLPADETASA